MRKGSKGDSVKELQENLIKLGFGKFLGKYVDDSIYGDMTESTVKQFQKWVNIKVDGIVGKVTNRNLKKRLKQAGKKGTYNFNISEFKCKGSGKLLSKGMDNNLMYKLEMLRLEFGNQPIIINSGYRSKKHNRRVGGVSNSQHLYGKASDIDVQGVSAHRVYSKADKIFSNGGVGKYNTFTHVDTRGYRARF